MKVLGLYDECVYSKKDVCEILGISTFTLDSWYSWERKEIKSKSVNDFYLPKPMQASNEVGRPLRWSLDMIDSLRVYKSRIVRGRNGKYGKYTNAKWHAVD